MVVWLRSVLSWGTVVTHSMILGVRTACIGAFDLRRGVMGIGRRDRGGWGLLRRPPLFFWGSLRTKGVSGGLGERMFRLVLLVIVILIAWSWASTQSVPYNQFME